MKQSMNGTGYIWKPIIVEGVNHSGTRVLVQILSVLGSDGGDDNNQWKENKFFLGIHQTMIAKLGEREWTETIYDLSFVREFQDDLRFRDSICSLLKTELLHHYPAAAIAPWHWKCPTSALFEKTWIEVFPEAYYIHIIRDPVECAESFLRRRQFRNMKEGVEYYRLMETRIREVQKKHYLQVRYDTLADDIRKIQNFLPFEVDDSKVELAKSLIKKEDKYWYRHKTLRQNLLNIRAKLLSSFFQIGYAAKNESKW